MPRTDGKRRDEQVSRALRRRGAGVHDAPVPNHAGARGRRVDAEGRRTEAAGAVEFRARATDALPPEVGAPALERGRRQQDIHGARVRVRVRLEGASRDVPVDRRLVFGEVVRQVFQQPFRP